MALHRAKLWSKYAKDVMTYVEKRCHLVIFNYIIKYLPISKFFIVFPKQEAEFAKNVAKLAQTMKSALKEEVRVVIFFSFSSSN